MIDKVIIATYLILVVMIGLRYSKKSHDNLRSYNNIGVISNNVFIIGATIFATAVGGGTTFGIADKVYSGNIIYAYALICAVPFDLWIGYYIVPRLIKHYGAVSVGDIISKHYGREGRIIAGIASTLVSIGYLAAQINVSGLIFQDLFEIKYIYCVIISYIIVIFYTTLGGLKTVVINNVIQFVMMLLAIPTMTIIGLEQVGVTHFIDKTVEYHRNLQSDTMIYEVAVLALCFGMMGLVPSFIQRVVSGKNATVTRNSIVYKSIVYVFFIICITANGLLARYIVPDVTSNMAIPAMIDTIIPTGLRGIVLIGLLASVMSTADSDLNIAAISITNDILKPLFLEGKAATSSMMQFILTHKLVIFTQFMTVVIGTAAIFIALCFNNVVDLVFFSAGFWTPMMFVPIMSILFDKVIPAKYMIMNAAISALAFVLCTTFGEYDIAIGSILFATVIHAILHVYRRIVY